MDQTSLSLLNRLRSDNGSAAWNDLHALYAPWLRVWIRKYDVQPADVDDLLQEVLMAVAKDAGKFQHNGRAGAFRSWLRTILANRLRNFWRSRGLHLPAKGGSEMEQRIAQLEDPASELHRLWDQQHDQHVLGQLLKLNESQFAPTTWQAFFRVTIGNERPDVVADDLGISLNAVFIAKSRVLTRLREQAAELVETL